MCTGIISEGFTKLLRVESSITMKLEGLQCTKNHTTILTTRSSLPMKPVKFLFRTNDDWQSCKNILQKMKRTLVQVSCLCLFSKYLFLDIF